MTPQEKLQLIEELWDDLCQSPDHLPIPDWHKEELDRRHAAAEMNPEAREAWDTVRERLRRGQG